MAKKWIKKALRSHKKGALHKQLGIESEEHIPDTLLVRIKDAPINSYIYNGFTDRDIKVTKLLKRRAVLALNLRRMK